MTIPSLRLDNFKSKNPIFGFAFHSFLHGLCGRAVVKSSVKVVSTASAAALSGLRKVQSVGVDLVRAWPR